MLRRATTGDLPAILELEALFEPRERWSSDSWSAELRPDRFTIVLESQGRIVAVATFRTIAAVCDLNRIIVEPAHRGGRLADWLIEAGFERAKADGATRMLLEVASENEAAIRCYVRHGFMEIARRDDYYAPGTAALVMEVPID